MEQTLKKERYILKNSSDNPHDTYVKWILYTGDFQDLIDQSIPFYETEIEIKDGVEIRYFERCNF